jgi:predicted phage terminase large subunit-like protein
LRAFIAYVIGAYYKADPAHDLIADTLDRVLHNELTRLLIIAAPQHGKSLLVSTLLPAYWLGQRPNDPIIITSYGASLAEYHSKRSRAIVESFEFQRLYPNCMTDLHSRARDHWNLASPNRGRVLAVGVGGPITGHGGRLNIIDDPFENWEQAQNPRERERVWDWYRGTFRTRVLEDGAIVMIATRWHEDDLAGRLLHDSEDWTVLRLPALAETQDERDAANKYMGLPLGQSDPLGRQPGEALAPQRFSAEALASLRRDVGSLVWGAEYQGAPHAAEGNRIKRVWLSQFVSELPVDCHLLRYWDKAGTEGGGAFTSGVLLAQTPDDPARPRRWRWYVVDVEHGQWSSGERNAIIRQTAELDTQKYGAGVQVWVEQEPGSGGKESAEISVMDLAGFSVYVDRVTGSKDVRMEPLIAQIEGGNVSLLRGDWNGNYIDELCAIPNGKYRDQADASSGAFNKLILAAGREKIAGAWGRTT